ncbi:MAG: hypothetical protein II707_04515, partial [Spirochaetales bacterium]|nr:hypothetical protein [Spirochaetales bacterium]
NTDSNTDSNTESNTDSNTENNKTVIQKEKNRKNKKTTTTEKNSDVVVDISSPQSESVTDCNGLQNMSDEQIAGAIALLDSLDIDVASPPLEVSAEDVNSILIDDDAAFNPDDDVIDFDTQQQQEADKAAAALIDDKSKMRDTLTKTYAITESLADIMLSKHDVPYIQGKIDLLSKQKNIDNPGAWLIKACREDYQVAAVTQEKPPTQSTRNYSDDLYDQFCQHFKRVFNQDFTHKALYENAVNLLGSESKVDYLLTVIDDYKGNPRIKEILTANHCHGFSEVMKSESAMGELIGFGMAQSSKDMAEKIKELPWMQQDKQGA